MGQARADMLVTTTKPGGTEPTDYFIEVEVCYKGGQEIQKKCAAYVRAWDDSVGGFPYVVIVAPNDDRRAAMQEVVDGMGKDGELFKVCVVDRLVETIKRTAAAPKVAAI